LPTLEKMQAMQWGPISKAKFIICITLMTEHYMEYSTPPKITLKSSNSSGDPLKWIIDTKLQEFLYSLWEKRLLTVEKENKSEEKNMQKEQNIITLVSMGFPYPKVLDACDCSADLDQALMILIHPREALIKLFNIPPDSPIDFALEAHQSNFQNSLNFLKQYQEKGPDKTIDLTDNSTSLFSDAFKHWDDRRDFFSNIINTTTQILSSCTTHCMFCSSKLPTDPFSAICDMCLATYSFPFVNLNATGTVVRGLNMTNDEDVGHLAIVDECMRILKPYYSSTKWSYIKVDYWRNYKLVKQYEECLMNAKNKTEMYLWHGTANENIEPIMKDNFSLFHLGKNSGNNGYFGAGMYFSGEHIRVAYDNKVLLCKVLVGNVYNWPQNKPIEIGCGKIKGYDTHYSGQHASGKDEYVIFEMARILPCYVVHLKQSN